LITLEIVSMPSIITNRGVRRRLSRLQRRRRLENFNFFARSAAADEKFPFFGLSPAATETFQYFFYLQEIFDKF
jgi:hypothetical protein